MAEANPLWGGIPSVTIPPKISILNPQNHSTYSSGDLIIKARITKAVTSSPTTFHGLGVSLFLDGIRIDSISEYIPRSKVDIDTVLHDPLIGNHKLEVKASYALGYSPGLPGFFSVESTSTVYFTIENTPSSSPSPSPEPTPTLEPTATPGTILNIESSPTSLVIASSVIVAVLCAGLGLLVYFIKRK